MFFRKKNPQENLRRRFHHLLISKRKETFLRDPIPRLRRPQRSFSSLAVFLRFKKIFIAMMAAGIFVGMFYVTFFSSFFTTDKISVDKKGNAVAINSLMPFLDTLKGKNIIFTNTAKLENELEQTFKNEILLVKINKSYPSKLSVKVEEYPASINLRVITPEKNQKFVLNQIGYAIWENMEQKELPVLILKTDKPFKGRGILIDKEKLTPILDIYRRFTEIFGMKIVEGEWIKTARELHLKTEKNFTLWFDLTANTDKQLSKLKRSLPKLDIYREPLEYIDLRIAGTDSEKVIFKRR